MHLLDLSAVLPLCARYRPFAFFSEHNLSSLPPSLLAATAIQKRTNVHLPASLCVTHTASEEKEKNWLCPHTQNEEGRSRSCFASQERTGFYLGSATTLFHCTHESKKGSQRVTAAPLLSMPPFMVCFAESIEQQRLFLSFEGLRNGNCSLLRTAAPPTILSLALKDLQQQ